MSGDFAVNCVLSQTCRTLPLLTFAKSDAGRIALQSTVGVEKLDLIGFVAGNDCGTRLWRGDYGSTLAVNPRDGRFSRFHVRLGNLRIRFSSLVQFVVELVFGFLKLFDSLAHSAGRLP